MNLHASHSLTIVIVGEKAAAGDANVASCTSCWTSTAAATARRANLLANWDSMRDKSKKKRGLKGSFPRHQENTKKAGIWY